ncbi:MAG TPA: MFS transporter [Patescibacteria group bacterium]|nr:MFS transporter [Patescibacteria group bacterium]
MTDKQKLILIISILAAFVAFLDSSVVNVALPAIIRDLTGGLIVQQWVVDAYLITLGSLILVAGSLSDILGRKKVLTYGLVGFGITSLLCAFAPNKELLIVFRGLQGIAGALLVPSSLAILISNFSGQLQSKAIGIWTAWTGISFIIGPLVGGILVDSVSWRAIFLINVLPITITLYLLNKLKLDEVKENRKLDWRGAVVCTLGLLGTVYALIEQPHFGWSSPKIYIPLLLGLVLLGIFVFIEKNEKDPMVSLRLFKVRNFSVGNIATLAIYGGLSVATFLLIIAVQQIGHYSAFSAGLSLLPVTLIMFVLSPRFGALSGKYGPRFFMSVGPMIAGIGFLLLLNMNSQMTYLTQVLPGILIFGLGLAMTVAPLTSAILGSIHPEQAGIGSAINNAVARIAGLIAVAFIGVIVGAELTISGFHKGVILMAILLIFGGVISAIGIQNHQVKSIS